MKIAISARMFRKEPLDGISRFTYEVITRIVRLRPEWEFALLFDRKPDPSYSFPENAEVIHVPPPSRHPLLWYTWHEWSLNPVLKSTGAGIFFSPDGIMPVGTEIPSVPAIHDISFHHRPGDVPFIQRNYYRYFFRIFAHKAARIITVSEFCRRDIATVMGIDQEKVDVAYNGVSDYFTPSSPDEKEVFRKGLTGGSPYFLFVGNFSPRKNIPGLIKAYNLFRNTCSHNHKLVLTGNRLYLNRETDLLIRSSPWKGDIILTGPVSHPGLRILYGASEALVFVPWFEGFGIPASEAMRCGTPVILSNTASLPEIGGDAALYVNPADPGEIASAMRSVADNFSVRSSLSSRGIMQSGKYNWEGCAGSVISSLEKVIAQLKR